MKNIDGSLKLIMMIADWFWSLFNPKPCTHLFGTRYDKVRHRCVLNQGHRGPHQDIKL